MVDTCKVFKKPVRCVACGTRQYETLLRIAQGAPVVCVECRQEIDLQHDNSEIFNDTVAFVQAELRGRNLDAAAAHARTVFVSSKTVTHPLLVPANWNNPPATQLSYRRIR
jgi:hypothetical protein